MGAVLGAALSAAGHPVVAVSAASDSARERAAALLPDASVTSPAEVVSRADLALLTVADEALPGLTEALAADGVVRPGQLVGHAVARHGTAILDPLTRQGALPLALHPAMTFTGTSVDLGRLSGCCFAVTAPEPLLPIAEALVVEMGAEPQVVPETSRALYSAALAGGADHFATLVAESLELLRIAGVNDPGRMLGPLVTVVLDGTLRGGDLALSGPVADGDAVTVAAHLGELAQVSGSALAVYVALARLTADRALGTGRLRPAAAEALLDVLADRATHSRMDP